MANEDPSKTEKPTPKKIKDARERGDVGISQDMTSLVTVLTGVSCFVFFGSAYYSDFTEVFRSSFSGKGALVEWDLALVEKVLIDGIVLFFDSFGMHLFLVTLLSALVVRLQVGSFFSTKPMELKFEQLNPAKGIKNILPNKDNLVKLAFTLAKVGTISLICASIIYGNRGKMAELIRQDTYTGVTGMLDMCIKLAFVVIVLFGVIASIDFWWKRKRYEEKQMMTKQEVKDEHRNAEGDPQMKAKIRQKMRAMIGVNLRKEISKGAMVLANPTHVTVVLKYEEGDYAPLIIAKGLRKRALLIREIAKEEGIPVIEAPPLARALYRSTDVGEYIEGRFFAAVAKILSKIYGKKSKKHRKVQGAEL